MKYNPLRLELRIRNNVLYRAIFDNYRSVSAFCKENDLDQGRVGALLNLKLSPRTTRGEYRPVAAKCASLLWFDEEDLFPDELYGIKNPRAEAELPISALAKTERPLLPDPQAVVAHEITRAEIRKALEEYLPPRTAEILRMRFGIGEPEHTLEEVALYYNLSRERIRQIEAKGLRVLRGKGKKIAERLSQ